MGVKSDSVWDVSIAYYPFQLDETSTANCYNCGSISTVYTTSNFADHVILCQHSDVSGVHVLTFDTISGSKL